MKPGRGRNLVLGSLLLGSALAALEATAVSAAMPTAVGELGGLSRYSWVFSIYLLTSTTTVPLFGKLADLYGRRRVYHAAVGVFIAGSALCGLARSMEQLIVFRAVQGIGAGGVMPVALTLLGDLFDLRERGRVQGYFSALWASASLIGPLVGGILTASLSWRWIFWLNLPLGLLSIWLLERNLEETPERRDHGLDVVGTLALSAAVTLLLLGVAEAPTLWGWSDTRTWGLLGASSICFVFFARQERRAPEPTLPVGLLRDRLMLVANTGSAISGIMLFSLAAYVPLLAQIVLGGSALDAGAALAPMLLGWPIASTLAGRLIGRVAFRPMALVGGVLMVAAGGVLWNVGAHPRIGMLRLALFLIGLGLGFTTMPYVLAVQSAVPWSQRGVASSLTMFSRTIGGTIAVALLGTLFNTRVSAAAPGLPLEAVLRPHAAGLSPADAARLSGAVAHGLSGVMAVLAVTCWVSLIVAWCFPANATGDEPVAQDLAAGH
jgi:EmrB/QacA subfamily drug resistance transporter